MKKHYFLILALAALTTASVGGNKAYAANDPLETYNRVMFSFNEGVDTILLRPVARGFRLITPEPARKGLRNAFRNLYEPLNAGNALLQGDVEHFFVSSWRFVLNSTFGMAGLYDFAGEYGNLPYRREDFGQTLGVWFGETHSPYLVLPLIGPRNVRDTVGFVVDIFTNPWFYLLERDAALVALGTEVIVDRESLLDPLDQIYKTSFDPYASIRSAYQQRRASQILNRRVRASAVDGF